MEIIALSRLELEEILKDTWNKAIKESDVINGAEYNATSTILMLKFRMVVEDEH